MSIWQNKITVIFNFFHSRVAKCLPYVLLQHLLHRGRELVEDLAVPVDDERRNLFDIIPPDAFGNQLIVGG